MATLALCGPRIAAGMAQASRAFDALAGAMARTMADGLLAGGTPIDLARAWLSDPLQRAAVTSLSDAIGHLPETGEEISIGRFDFRIARADARRVHALHVIVRGDA